MGWMGKGAQMPGFLTRKEEGDWSEGTWVLDQQKEVELIELVGNRHLDAWVLNPGGSEGVGTGQEWSSDVWVLQQETWGLSQQEGGGEIG